MPDVADGFVETVSVNWFGWACTTKRPVSPEGWSPARKHRLQIRGDGHQGQALALVDYLNKRVKLDQPINIHLTGCPNSCAQHYIGDIGLQGVKSVPTANHSKATYRFRWRLGVMPWLLKNL